MKAVLFDFNGTLYNDTRFHMEAWYNFFKKRGMELTMEEVRRRCIGPSNTSIFCDFFGSGLSREEMKRLEDEKEAEYRASARSNPENLQLVPGAPELFELLTARGIPFAVATASPIENVEFYMEDLQLKRWLTMDRIVYEEGKLASKPDPAFYIEAARRLGLTPEACIVVEDSRTGIQAAVNAGAGRIIALDGTTSREWLEAQREITAIIHDFRGFEQYL